MAEDDSAIREMYQLKLEMDGWELLLAANGEEAVQLAFEQRPLLILLDMQMPRLDGIGVLRRLREDPRTSHTPVFVLSNSPASTRMEDAYEFGIVMWLVKSSVTPAIVSKILSTYLSNGGELGKSD